MNKLELVIFNMRIEGVGFYGQTLAALIGLLLIGLIFWRRV
ncbi:hypothetical protein FHT70_006013 [Rhizobium sp. BK049]|nr:MULTISPECIES: hypothetical protein [Rhizobium]MBB3356040.1 hypothetical protein [Rhizobium sp. BK049]